MHFVHFRFKVLLVSPFDYGFLYELMRMNEDLMSIEIIESSLRVTPVSFPSCNFLKRTKYALKTNDFSGRLVQIK